MYKQGDILLAEVTYNGTMYVDFLLPDGSFGCEAEVPRKCQPRVGEFVRVMITVTYENGSYLCTTNNQVFEIIKSYVEEKDFLTNGDKIHYEEVRGILRVIREEYGAQGKNGFSYIVDNLNGFSRKYHSKGRLQSNIMLLKEKDKPVSVGDEVTMKIVGFDDIYCCFLMELVEV